MDRRKFMTWLGVSVMAPLALRQPTPAPAGRPDPIDLGSGITLVDYRLHPGATPHVIGEIRNDTDRMIDAPVVSLTYPRGELSDGFTWASPIIPIIEAGKSIPIFGPLPGDADPGAILASATFALCTLAEPGDYTTRQQALQDDLVVTVSSEQKDPSTYNVKGTIENTGSGVLRDLAIRGVFRDSDQRIAGTAASPSWNAIAPGISRDFSMWARGNYKANPFTLLNGTDYTVQIIAGTRGPVASPGCSFGRPWD